ncbi:hypothetical protein BVY01_04635 [bacterium I07]|nr:hypothetical protein BVY01_04635 [bacterium I07]
MNDKKIHCYKGVTISHDVHVDKSDRRFKRDDLLIIDTQKTYLWGYVTATGKEVKMTIRDYFSRYFYNNKFPNIGYVHFSSPLTDFDISYNIISHRNSTKINTIESFLPETFFYSIV